MTKSIFTALVWLVLAAITILMIAQPIGLQAQFVLSLAAIVSLLVIRLISKTGTWRFAFLAIASVVVLRYFYWRTTSTIPPVSLLVNFVPGIIIYAAEAYSVVMLFISMFVVLDPLKRARAPRLDDSQLPTVDVLVPTYNEDLDLVATTLAAAKGMIYPAHKLKVYLCDDGGTDQKLRDPDPAEAAKARNRRDQMVQVCEQLGVGYLTRAKNESAKAGNLTSAMKHTTGELIVVFDADHAPSHDFLQETVGYFSLDARLFLVQTPHFFLNPDPIEKNLDTWRYMPSENEMFYSETQLGLDKWNATFFCGSAAVLRRKALEENGGISGETITEDCETSVDIQSRGWNSVYVDRPMIAGLQPTDFSAFIGQRSRWARGMVQILLLKNPLLRRGLTLAQRVCYLSSSMFWLFPLVRMIFVIVPLLTIFLDLQIFRANLQEFIAYTGSYMIVNLLIQNYLFGRLRWTWVSEIYEYAQSMYLYQAVLSVFLNPRNPTFKVTDKGTTFEHDHISELAPPFVFVFFVLLFAEIIVGYRIFTDPSITDVMMIVGGWNTLNLLIAAATLGVVSERHELRRSHRVEVTRAATIIIGGISYRVNVEDASQGGMKIRPVDTNVLPVRQEDGVIGLMSVQSSSTMVPTDPVSVVIRKVASDALGTWYGAEFLHMQAREYYVVADLMYADSSIFAKFRESRRKSYGVIANTLRLVKWGVTQPLRLFSYFILNRRLETAAKKPPRGPQTPALVSPLQEEVRMASEHTHTHTVGSTSTIVPVVAAAALGLGLMLQPADVKAQTLPTPANQGSMSADIKSFTAVPVAVTPTLDDPDNSSIVPSEWLRRLPASAETLRFNGESGSRTFPVYVTRNQAAGLARIKIGFTNAVSVMPEASTIKVYVNDVLVSNQPLNGVVGTRRAIATIPAGVLQPGFNQVRLVVSQRHRVDCTVAGTYELWTQLDPAETGLLFPIATQNVERIADLPGISSGPDGRLHVRMVIARPNDTDLVARAFTAAQQVSLATGITDPVVEVGNTFGTGQGLDVVVGTVGDFKALGFDDKVAAEAGRGATLIKTDNMFKDRVTIAVGGLNTEELDNSIGRLSGLVWAGAVPGTPAGFSALQAENGLVMKSGETYQFKDIGLPTVEFSGRTETVGTNVQLPPDFLAGDYRTLEARIQLAYVAGLQPGAQFAIRVNNVVVANVDLVRADGDTMRERVLNIPLDKFRPGTNRIELTSNVPAYLDNTCSPSEQINGSPRIVVLETSSFTFPQYALVGQLPSISSTLAGGQPFVPQGKVKLYLPRADAASVNTAATFLTRLANSTGKILPTEILQGAPTLETGTALIIGAASDMPASVLETVGLDARRLSSTLVTTNSNLGVGIDTSRGLTPGQLRLTDGRLSASNSVVDRLAKAKAQEGAYWPVLQPLVDGLKRTFSMPVGLVAGSVTGLVVPPADTTLAVGQNVHNGGTSTWTVITSGSSELMNRSVNSMVQPANWGKFGGQITAFNATTGEATVYMPDRTKFLTTGLGSISNIRLAIAGWFSLNIAVFVFLTLVAALVLGLFTSYAIRGSGRRSVE